MGLSAERPPQELLDSLSLDAAWKRAQDLEREVNRLRAVLKATNEAFKEQCARRFALEEGIREIVAKYPAMDQDLTTDLLNLP